MSQRNALLSWTLFGIATAVVFGRVDVWNDVPCNKEYKPENCDLENEIEDVSSQNVKYNLVSKSFLLVTVDDYDRCAPGNLSLIARNYFLAAAGRRITYRENKEAFDRIKIVPKMLRDVSKNSLETQVLGLKVDFPIGLSPVALQKLVTPAGELDTLEGISSMKTIMIVSSFASTRLEDIGLAAQGRPTHLWMQLYVFENRTLTIELVRSAEKNGYKGIVVTVDSSVDATLTCNARKSVRMAGISTANFDVETINLSPSITFSDITWLRGLTRLPIIAKGLLSGEDASRAVIAGASAILVSNHGGRQMDGAPATIDVLPGVVAAVRRLYPRREVYMDGGVRSGHDVYKALARGAKMVFVGRPQIWGLALGGAEGVRQVITTLRNELNETILLAGSSRVTDFGSETLIPAIPIFG